MSLLCRLKNLVHKGILKEKDLERIVIIPKDQQPCDCISRAELLKAVDAWDKFGCDADSKLVPYKDCYVPYIHYDDVVKAIKGMSSIQSKTDVLDKIRAEIKEESRFCPLTEGLERALEIIDKYKAENTSNCDSCKNRNEVDGSNCYECVKGIRNNYKADSEKEFLPQYEGKWVAESEE